MIIIENTRIQLILLNILWVLILKLDLHYIHRIFRFKIILKYLDDFDIIYQLRLKMHLKFLIYLKYSCKTI